MDTKEVEKSLKRSFILLTFPNLSENAIALLEKRYYLSEESTPDQLFWRVAKACANNPYEEKLFFHYMRNLIWLPNSPALFNAGNLGAKNGSWAACFVYNIQDSMDSIMDVAKKVALTLKAGGGCGIVLSHIRPEGAIVNSTHGKAMGPVAVMKMISEVARMTTQAGKRQAANLACLAIDHPDIEKFIKAKDLDGDLNNFNISVGMYDEFMERVEGGEEEACRIFDSLVYQAWKNGDPGLLFLDEINRKNPNLVTGEDKVNRSHPDYIHGTNPCGEQALPDNGVCNLLSINLAAYLKLSETEKKQAVESAVNFMDNLIDKSPWPNEDVKKRVQKERRLGLGLMGIADALVDQNLAYDSEEGRGFLYEKISAIREMAIQASKELSKKRGKGYQQRNLTLTTIAPTGSISILANCSSGLEPHFAWAYLQRRYGEERIVIEPVVERYLGEEKCVELIKETNGDVKVLDKKLSKMLPPHYKKARDIQWKDHLRMQQLFQYSYSDSSISKTINLPNNATTTDVREIYTTAWRLRLKSITVYRDGSRSNQVMDVSTKEKRTKERISFLENHAPKRPPILGGVTHKVKIQVSDKKEPVNSYITVNFWDEHKRPFELFVHGNIREEGIAGQYLDMTTRMTSLALRHGVPLPYIIQQLEKIPEQHMYSIPLKLANILQNYLSDEQNQFACPDCSKVDGLIFEEGCLKCKSCNWSRCS